MNNYRKGKNIEEPLDKNKIPIEGLPENFLWMQVRGGSKIRNLLSHALEEFPQKKHVVWTGFGPSVGKAVTCAEIMKKECDNTLHQVTKVCYRLIEEYWDPILPELDQLVVKRKLPMIHIYLSMDTLNKTELGYQGPGETTPYKLSHGSFHQDRKISTNAINDKRGHTLEEFVSHKLTVGTSNKKDFKYKNKDKKTLVSEHNKQSNVHFEEDIGEQIENENSGNVLMKDTRLNSYDNTERCQGEGNLRVISNKSKKNKKQRFQGQSKNVDSCNIDFKSHNR